MILWPKPGESGNSRNLQLKFHERSAEESVLLEGNEEWPHRPTKIGSLIISQSSSALSFSEPWFGLD